MSGEEKDPIGPTASRLVLDDEPPRASVLKRLMKLAVYLGLVAALACLGGLLAGYVYFKDQIPEVPDLAAWRPPILSEAYTTDEVLIAEFFRERRKVVPYERIPKKLVQAFIASEDSAFFDHPGFDPVGIAGAAWKNLTSGRVRGGGSTLTQQTAKALLISAEGYKRGREKSVKRKIKELLLALELEKRFSKEQIVGSSRVDLQACKLEYSIVSPK